MRAIHLDIVPEMTKQAFIHSFKRFTSRSFPVGIVYQPVPMSSNTLYWVVVQYLVGEEYSKEWSRLLSDA